MKKVDMLRSGNLVAARPDSDSVSLGELHQILRDGLHYNLRTRNTLLAIRNGAPRFRSDIRYLCKLQDDSVVFMAGLLSRAASCLRDRGIATCYHDQRPNFMPAPDMSRLQHDLLVERPEHRICLAKIFSSDMGVIASATGYGKSTVIFQVVRAYPTIPIIVATYRRDVCDTLYQRARDHVSPPDLGRVGGGHNRPARVTISTIDSILRANPEQCRLLLYDEVHEAGSESRSKLLASIRLARRFGFSASPKGRSDNSDMVIEALFGPVLYEYSYQATQKAGYVASITVRMLPVHGSEIPYDDDIAVYRYGIWRNALRNRMIASAARQYLSSGAQTLVMVDKVEHALFLKRDHLQEWPIVCGAVDVEQQKAFRRIGLLHSDHWLPSSTERSRMREQFESGKMRYAIATGVWSQGVDFRQLECLVRCDAGSGLIRDTQLPGRLSRGESGVLIDFMDLFDDRFKRKSASRLSTYRSHGWTIEESPCPSTM